MSPAFSPSSSSLISPESERILCRYAGTGNAEVWAGLIEGQKIPIIGQNFVREVPPSDNVCWNALSVISLASVVHTRRKYCRNTGMRLDGIEWIQATGSFKRCYPRCARLLLYFKLQAAISILIRYLSS